MLQLKHFDKKNFIDVMKTKHLMTYFSTTLALMLMLVFYSFIQGDFKAEFFLYAFLLSLAFALWDVIDHVYRKQQKASISE